MWVCVCLSFITDIIISNSFRICDWFVSFVALWFQKKELKIELTAPYVVSKLFI